MYAINAEGRAKQPQIRMCATLEQYIERGTLSRSTIACFTPQQLNEQLPNGQLPLHFAVSCGKKTAVKLLIECGAQVNAQDAQGRSALEVAALSLNVPIFKFLTQHGAALTPKEVSLAASCDPLSSYIYHATRHIQPGSRKDGNNKLGNMSAQQAHEVLSTLAVFSDCMTELTRACKYGADVNCVHCNENLISHAQKVQKPELIRFALTQGLPGNQVPDEMRIELLKHTTDWYKQQMIGRECALDDLVYQIQAGQIDRSFYRRSFAGKYAININRPLPDLGIDALELATRNGDRTTIGFLISHGAYNRRNARTIALQTQNCSIYRMLHKTR